MVKYATAAQRAKVLEMVQRGEPATAIQAETGISISQAYRYRKRFKLNGDPFNKSKAPLNAIKFKLEVVEVCEPPVPYP